MDISTIRQRLKNYRPRLIEPGDYKPSAVLIPLFLKNKHLHVLFTKRNEKVESHKGQISFPGGAMDSEDSSMLDTALRESFEEVGIRKGDVQILGSLDEFKSITGFKVTPFVGVITYPYVFQVNEDEIDLIFDVPLKFLLDEKNVVLTKFEYEGINWPTHVIQYQNFTIWGLTARILVNFLQVIKGIDTYVKS